MTCLSLLKQPRIFGFYYIWQNQKNQYFSGFSDRQVFGSTQILLNSKKRAKAFQFNQKPYEPKTQLFSTTRLKQAHTQWLWYVS